MVPDVVGQPSQAAIQALQDAGFVVADVVLADGARGTVLATDPVAGGRVERGTTVVLTVGAGTPPPPAPEGDDEGGGNGGGGGNGNGNGRGNGNGHDD